ncbi:hypothetical protein Tsubulata_034279 [Turnera subulata]|uniref:DUF4283 domain-containing protein n=1 Tax=Turnera subulata TaxID=218843 RepID=A0A9Q0F7L4_9ROSI|nr:hypothetical protein Tsubulata_034279 [Turnera subulata]
MAEASRRVIDLGGNDTDQRTPDAGESLGAIVARTYVVGKILGDRRPHISQIRSQIANVWYIKGDFRIIPKPNNVFLIGFELEEDKKKVLKGSPCLVSNMHFCLKGWFSDMILSHVSFRQVMFWVQLHDIPTGLLRHDKIARIGSIFAVFHHYKPSLEAMLGWQGFIRARVEIEIEKPLLPGVACLDTTGNEIWVKFQYERLGELCNRCGLITHPTNRCLKPPRHDEGIERPAENSFGPWMRAKEILGKHYPAKKQTPLEQEEEQGTEPQVKGKEILRFDEEGGEADGNSIAPNKKRKTMEADVQPPIQNAARRDHTGIMNTVAELVSELHDASPIQASASKPSWKRMARKAKAIYNHPRLSLFRLLSWTWCPERVIEERTHHREGS